MARRRSETSTGGVIRSREAGGDGVAVGVGWDQRNHTRMPFGYS